MSEHGHCHDCGGHDGKHFEGCIYEGTSDVGGHFSYGRGGSSNHSAGKCWAWYILALILGYGINELIGVIMIIGLIFWLCVS